VPTSNDEFQASTRLVVRHDRHETRLDVFLAAETDLSRRAARRLISDGSVWRNSEPVRVQSKTLIAGDVVDVLLASGELGVPALPDAPLPVILFEDRWMLVADKPAGVLCQPAEDSGSEPALDQQTLLGLAVRDGRRPFLRLVHRIDRLTSGAVLFARNPQALRPLARAWADGEVDRRYLAVVEGHPPEDRWMIDAPIGRDREHRWRFQVDDRGKPARTELSVRRRLDNGCSLVECRLLTGRTHQVRVHLASAGHPVVGDRLYGARPNPAANRPLLHASSLTLPHPSTGDEVVVEGNVPEDMVRFVGD
jgi:23S rRNA pseudouridine1911/1915/1917 synthase